MGTARVPILFYLFYFIWKNNIYAPHKFGDYARTRRKGGVCGGVSAPSNYPI